MRIDAVASVNGLFAHGLFAHGSRRLVDLAAKQCLERADCRPEELDLLVNVGIYKERGLAEPAFAALVQDDIRANPGKALHEPAHGHGTFSFDLLNGGCGVMSALQVLDGFLSNDVTRSALIVAGDVLPEDERGFPYASTGGAVLLRSGGSDRFVRFLFRTFPQDAALFDARVEWDAAKERNVVVVDEEPAFAPRCREHGATVARELLELEGLSAERDIDLLIASQYPRRFPSDLASALELHPEAVPVVGPEHMASHTSGALAALEAAIESGRFAAARRVLFVAVGAGITACAALYQRG